MDFADFSRETFTPTAEVSASSRLLSEIVFGTSCDRSGHAGEIPSSVLAIIERRKYTDLKGIDPFRAILTILRQNHFNLLHVSILVMY
jgi:hypothetical protein